MTIYYSFAASGFFDDAVNVIPPDAIEISEELRASLIEGQAYNGKIIIRSSEGLPVLGDPPPPSADQIYERNFLMQTRLLADASSAMTPLLVALQLGDATEEETAKAKAWRSYYKSLQALDLSSPSPAWPEAPSAG